MILIEELLFDGAKSPVSGKLGIGHRARPLYTIDTGSNGGPTNTGTTAKVPVVRVGGTITGG